jgi:hypothetical protein
MSEQTGKETGSLHSERPRQTIEVTGLHENPALASRVLLVLWRALLDEPRLRAMVLQDLAELVSTYGGIEPVFTPASAARLALCSLRTWRDCTYKWRDELKPPVYRLVKNERNQNRKQRLYYASDIQTIREKRFRHGWLTGARARVAARRRQQSGRNAVG